jgi:hypothetical protein
MGYYKEHLKKVKNPIVLNPGRLERGMVAMIRYKKMDDHISKPYMIFVLQPNWPNDSTGKLHSLSLDNVNPVDFAQFAKDYPESMAKSNKVKKLNLSKLKIDETSRRFYSEEISKNEGFRGSYRIFDPKRISVTSVVNYDYGKYDKIS